MTSPMNIEEIRLQNETYVREQTEQARMLLAIWPIPSTCLEEYFHMKKLLARARRVNCSVESLMEIAECRWIFGRRVGIAYRATRTERSETSLIDDFEEQLKEHRISRDETVDLELLSVPSDEEFEFLLQSRKTQRKVVRMADFSKEYVDRMFTVGLDEPDTERVRRFDALFINANRYFITSVNVGDLISEMLHEKVWLTQKGIDIDDGDLSANEELEAWVERKRAQLLTPKGNKLVN